MYIKIYEYPKFVIKITYNVTTFCSDHVQNYMALWRVLNSLKSPYKLP